MKNILHVIGYLGRGGDTAVVLQVLSRMDRQQYHFDFVTHEGRTRQETVSFCGNRAAGSTYSPGMSGRWDLSGICVISGSF